MMKNDRDWDKWNHGYSGDFWYGLFWVFLYIYQFSLFFRSYGRPDRNPSTTFFLISIDFCEQLPILATPASATELL